MVVVKLKKVNAPTCEKCDNKSPLKNGGYVNVEVGKGGAYATYSYYCGKCKEEYWLDRIYPAYVNTKNPSEFWKIAD